MSATSLVAGIFGQIDALDDLEDAMEYGVFVPAIMSAGLLFSLSTVLRDLFQRSGDQALEHRGQVVGASVADLTLGSPLAVVRQHGLRSRFLLASLGLALFGIGVYLVPGAAGNYLRDGGYVSDIATLWAVSLIAAAVLGGLGITLLTAAATSPYPPPRLRPLLVRTPLTSAHEEMGPLVANAERWTAVASVSASLLLALTIVVATSSKMAEWDISWTEWIAGWWPSIGEVPADVFGRTDLTLALVLLIGIATLRCRALAVAYLISVIAGSIFSNVLKLTVSRPRPPESLTSNWDSYPSGHVLQVVILTTLVPLALHVLTKQRWVQAVTTIVLIGALFATAMERVVLGRHWPTDALGGILAGLLIASIVRIILAQQRLHGRCRECPWSETVEASEPAPVR